MVSSAFDFDLDLCGGVRENGGGERAAGLLGSFGGGEREIKSFA